MANSRTNEADILVDLGPNRPLLGLPQMYQTFSHPKRQGPGRIFYYLEDTSALNLHRVAQREKTLKIPLGSEADAVERGYLRLVEDDIVFVRSLLAPSNGELDVAVCWITGGRIISNDMKSGLQHTRDFCLGPRELRTRDPATRDEDGKYSGGSDFERNGLADPVHPNTRVFTIGNSYEDQTHIMAPCKGDKVRGDQDHRALGMRKALLQTGSAIALRSLEEGPAEVLEHIKINAELTNVPAMGTVLNVAYTGAQLNLSGAESHDSKETLAKSIGPFGDAHRDKKDSPAHYTHMTAMSDLPNGYDPGRFFILYPGVFISLDNYSCINFSGLRFHGSTPPRAPAGADPSELLWATRFCLIHYPPRGQTSGNMRYALGALPDHSIFFIPPEMTNAIPLPRTERGWCNHAQYLEDGSIVSDRTGHMNFVSRALYSAAHYFSLQLPEDYDVKIDMDKFLSAFTYIGEDGKRISADPWNLGPGFRRVPPASLKMPSTEESPGNMSFVADSSLEFVDQESIRAEKRKKWSNYFRWIAAHMPYEVSKSNGQEPLSPEDFILLGEIGDLTNCAENGHHEIPANPVPDVGGRPKVGSDRYKVHKRKATDTLVSSAPKRRKKAKKNGRFDNSILYATTSILGALHGGEKEGPADLDVNSKLRASNRLRAKGKQCMLRSPSPSPSPSEDEDYPEEFTLDDNIPVFLSQLTRDLLDRELDEVRTTAVAAATAVPEEEGSAVRCLKGLLKALQHSPVSKTAIGSLATGWQQLQSLEAISGRSVLITKAQRLLTMLANYRMWHWLDVRIASSVAAILNTEFQVEGVHKDNWLTTLVENVRLAFLNNTKERTYHALAYTLAVGDASCTIQLEAPWPQHQNRLNRSVASTVANILMAWFKFPSPSTGRPQAWFVHLIAQIDINLLYLDHIWTVYNGMSKNPFRRGAFRLNNFQNVKSLTEVAPYHPLFDINSPERRVVVKIGSIIDEFVEGRQPIPDSADFASCLDLPSQLCQDDVFSGQLPSVLQPFSRNRVTKFASFLEDAMRFVLSLPNPTPTYPKLLRKFNDIPDKSIPFRELASGRLRFKEKDGPYSSESIRSTRGIFSAVIWRGVTFASDFSLEGPMLFSSPENFYSVCEEQYSGKGKEFFCDQAAYGRSNPGRSVALIPRYWQSLQNDVWPDLIQDRKLPFKECYTFFRSQVKVNNSTVQRFPHLGPLATYLLTADLVYAEVVETPSIEDISWVIQHLNKGAAAALEDLGLIAPRNPSTQKPGEGETLAALHFLIQVALKVIPEKHHAGLYVDYIFLEHALCKFRRATRKGWIDLGPI